MAAGIAVGIVVGTEAEAVVDIAAEEADIVADIAADIAAEAADIAAGTPTADIVAGIEAAAVIDTEWVPADRRNDRTRSVHIRAASCQPWCLLPEAAASVVAAAVAAVVVAADARCDAVVRVQNDADCAWAWVRPARTPETRSYDDEHCLHPIAYPIRMVPVVPHAGNHLQHSHHPHRRWNRPMTVYRLLLV